MSKEKIREILHHDAYSELFEKRRGLANRIFDQKFISFMLKQIKLSNVPRALEVGCGTGRILHALKSILECDAVGVDISLGMVKMCKKKLGSRADFAVCDGEHLPFRDKSFDIVYCYGLLHHLIGQSGDAMFNGVREMVRCSMRFVAAIEPNMFNPFFFMTTYIFKRLQKLMVGYDRVPHERPLTAKALISAFINAGLKNVRAWCKGFAPPSTPDSVALYAYKAERALEVTPLKVFGTHIVIVANVQRRLEA